MHDGNYDPKDPRCIKHKGLIDKLEERRVRYENNEDSKLYSRTEEIRDAIDDIYVHLRVNAGYAPAWLINGLNELLDKNGRPNTYYKEARIFNSKFIDLLIKGGSSQAQAINLLGLLEGKYIIDSGFEREVRDSYHEYKNSELYEDLTDPTELGYFMMTTLNWDVQGIFDTEVNIKKSLPVFRDICSSLIEHVKKYHTAIKNFDSAYPRLYEAAFDWFEDSETDPILLVYGQYEGCKFEKYQIKNSFREFLNSIIYLNVLEKEKAS